MVKAALSAIAKNLERDAVDLLVHLANQLTSRYDLSSERARALSEGTKRFIPHRLTNARHISKLRPYLPQGTSIGLTEYAEEFNNFEEAVERFTFLMEQVAPKR